MKDFALPKPERLKLILGLFREQKYVQRIEIANICSTTLRTAQRDVDTLKEQRWPIERSSLGYYLRDASIAEKTPTSDAHFGVLMIAGCSIDKNIGSLMPNVAVSLKKEVLNLNEVSETEEALLVDRSLSVPQTIYSKEQLKTFGALSRSIIAECGVSFDYCSIGHSVSTQRSVFPIQLKLKDGIWYLLGWDLLREAQRVYTFNKIQTVRILRDSWKKPSVDEIDSVLKRGKFSIWDGGDQTTPVKIKVTSYAKEFVLNQKISENQIVEDSGDSAIVSFETSDLIGVNIWCRRFVADVEILAPTELRHSFVADLKKGIAINTI